MFPSGNFGNVFSGWIAKRMGAPIGRLVVASNANDILTRFFNDNDMSSRPVVASLSPSMDIQVSSNFERLLFEINRRDGGLTAEQLRHFRSSGRLSIEADQRAEHIDGVFTAARLDDDETLEVIRRTYRSTGMLVDPHTAVGIGVTERVRASIQGPIVTLATAHPAKFPDAVERATGVRPQLPVQLADLMERPEHFIELPNDLDAVQQFVEAHALAAEGRAPVSAGGAPPSSPVESFTPPRVGAQHSTVAVWSVSGHPGQAPNTPQTSAAARRWSTTTTRRCASIDQPEALRIARPFATVQSFGLPEHLAAIARIEMTVRGCGEGESSRWCGRRSCAF